MRSKKTTIYRTSSSEETKRLGEVFSEGFLKEAPGDKGASVVVLSGELGAGKTTFVQGFLHGLGVRRRVPSPTFVIMRRYVARAARKHVFHMDAYRLKDASHLSVLGFDELLEDPRNIVLIEWGERIKDAIPRGAVWIKFGYGKKEGLRNVSITEGGRT